MSREVDERVVSMQFNNKNFESNAQTTLGTLDKLKQKLNFSGASKGLENVGAAAKKVDMSGISSGIETVRTKFSAMEVIGVTALANITNSAVNAGKRIVSALTIDPVKTGLSEYELKLNSVQTIMASTGEDIGTVNKYLEELNAYSDQTIYSFSDMTQNIGKFTNAGVSLNDAVKAIKGISNAAALSGANTQEASRSMYNFAQALSAGYVKLIDWKSIELANMATKGFKEELIKTAVEVGTLTKKGEQYVSTTTDMNGKVSEAFTSTKFFNESLSSQWMTTDVLIKTLGRYTDTNTKLGKEATEAATQVKSLSQMFDVLKETAQSGWARTWEIIFGDLNQAKALFSPLTKFLGGIIDRMSDFRNTVLEGALGNPFESLLKKLDTSPLGKLSKSITDVTGKLDYYQDIVSKVWKGDYKNAPVRYQLLDDAGYDHRIVQTLVNKGYDYKLTVEDIESAYKKWGVATGEITSSTKDLSKTLEELSDEELKNLGYTDEEIRMLRALAKEAEKTGKPISELIEEMGKADGRTLLIDSFKNIGKTIGDLGKAIKKAWQEIFPPKTAEEKSIQLYNIIKALNEFTKKLRMSEETADKLKRTFKGVFALLDIILTVIGGPIKIIFKILKQLLGMANIDLLSLTAIIGDGIVKFRDWIDRVLDFTDVFKKLLPTLKKAGKAFGDWIDKLKKSDNIPRDIILGLVNGLTAGISIVGKTVWNLGKSIIEKICDVLGIHSPSREFIKIGKNIILGLIEGIQNGLGLVWGLITSIGKKLIEIVNDLSLNKILAGFLAGGIVIAVVKIAGALLGLVRVAKNCIDALDGLGYMFKGIGSAFKGLGMKLKADAVKSIAIAIAILVASVIALTFIDTGKLWAAIGAVAALAAIMALLAFAASKMGTISNKGDAAGMGKIIGTILGIAAALLLVAIAMKKLSSINPDQMVTGVIGLTAVVLALVGLMAATRLAGKDADKAGVMLLKISAALLIMVFVVKLMGWMDEDDVNRGLGVITLVSIVFSALIAVSKLAGEHADKAGKMFLKMSLALLIMTLVIKLMGSMDEDDVSKGLSVITLVGIVFSALIAVSKLAGKDADKVGVMLLKMSAALLILSITIKILASISDEGIGKGLGAITLLGVVFSALIAVSRVAGKQTKNIGTMLLAIAGALLIMTGVIWLLSLFDPSDLIRGLAAIVLMEACIAGLIAVTKLAKNSKNMQKTLIILTVAIAALIGAVIGLSFLDPAGLTRAAAAITLVIGAFALLIGITKLAKGTKTVQKTLITLTVVVAALAGVIALLSVCNPRSMLPASESLSLLLLSLSASMLILSKAKTISVSAKKALLPMLGVVAGLAVILALMSALDVDVSVSNVTAISILLNAMTASMLILSKAKTISVSAKNALLPMLGVIAGLAVILGLMSAFDVQASIPTAIAIGILLNAMAASMLILDHVNTVSATSIGAMAILGLVVAELAVVLGVMAAFNVEPSISTALALGVLLDAMAIAMVVLTAVGAGGPAAFVGVAALATLITGLGAVIIAIGALVDTFPSLERFLDTGIPILEKIGYGLGSFFGNIIGGFLGGITNGLPDMANDLSMFMKNLQPFIDGAKQIDSSVVSGVAAIADVVLTLTAANLIESLTSWFTGGSSIADFGEEMAALGPYLKQFGDSVKGIDASSIQIASNAAKTLAEMTATIPNEGGVVGWFAGENSISKFASELPGLGQGLKAFSDETNGIDPERVKAASNAAKTLAEMTATIPNTGGVVAWFAGENSITSFAEDLGPLGKGLKAFSDETSGIDPEGVKAASNAAKSLAEMADKIPNTDGVVAWFTGDNSLASFAGDLGPLGKGLKAFSDETSGIDPEGVKAASNAAKSLAEMADKVPNTGGVAAWFAGDNSISKFAKDLGPLGEGLKAFSDATNGINVTTVKAGVDAAGAVADMTKKLPNTGGFAQFFTGEKSLEDFSTNLVSLGKGIKGYSDSLQGVNTTVIIGATEAAEKVLNIITRDAGITTGAAMAITALPAVGKAFNDFYYYVKDVNAGVIQKAIVAFQQVNNVANAFSDTKVSSMATALSDIVKALRGMKDISPGSTKGFVQSIKNLADVNFDTFIFAFKEAASVIEKTGGDIMDAFIIGVASKQSAANTKMKNIGTDLVKAFNTGVLSQKGSVSPPMTTVLNTAIRAIQAKTSLFKTAGENAVKGFANGISANTYLAVAKAKAMAAAAAKAAKEELDENSPSKVFYGIGDFAGIAFVNALGDYTTAASDAGGELAKSSIEGLRDSMSNMFDVVNGNLDVQPTITPVLDLSEVQSGANRINGWFGGNRLLSINAKSFGHISTRLSEIQNGRNDDLITAINKLRRDMADMPRNNYNINGVSYEESSDVAEAFQTIIRAARIEGRV